MPAQHQPVQAEITQESGANGSVIDGAGSGDTTSPRPLVTQAHPLVVTCLADVSRIVEIAPNVVPGISDGEAWCSLYLVAKLRALGIKCPRISEARALMAWLDAHGYGVRHDAPRIPGDICYWDRFKHGARVGGHVSVFVEALPNERGRFVAGNSGPRADRVARSVHPLTRVTGAARPFA